MKKICGIYKITNQINGKSYIGQSVDINKRWNEHKRYWKTYDEILYRAIRKHKIENFSFEILELCDPSELNEKEILYIKKYNTYIGWKNNKGYNMTEGGGGVCGFIFSAETREKMSKAKKGKHHSPESKEKMREISRHTCTKGVVQYDEQGNYIAQFESVNEAGRQTPCNPSAISMCCRGMGATSSHYQWRFVQDVTENGKILTSIGKPKEPNYHMKPVIQYSLDGKLIRVFSGLKEASLATGFNKKCISACCVGKQKSAYGYIWKHKEEEDE